MEDTKRQCMSTHFQFKEQACPSRPTLLLNGLRHGGDGKAPANLQESANAMDLDNCYQRHIDNIGGASKTAEDCPVSDYWMLSVGDFSAAVEVELQLEFLTRYQAKPGSLLTFPCQQVGVPSGTLGYFVLVLFLVEKYLSVLHQEG